jgi:catechol 2,3-dioxygenase-like lactoylglutathione lyase family enzyme
VRLLIWAFVKQYSPLVVLLFTLGFSLSSQQQTAKQQPAQVQLAHFHHVHLNSTDPEAAIEFYTKHFDSEKAKFGDKLDAVWAQKSWLLFNKVNQAPPSDIVSAIYHIGWGAEDMKAEYQRQLGLGAKFDTPLTDGADLFGNGNPGRAYFAYVEGPDHALIEINTTNNHIFQHIHLLSADPVAAAQWYTKHFGAPSGFGAAGRSEPRVVNGLQVFPMTSVRMDNVNIIWFPKEFASQGVYKKQWEGRKDFASPRGRAIDHFAFSVDNLDQALARLRADGVKILQTPRTILNGKLRSAFIEGPDNVEIELVEGQARKE